MPRLTLLLLPLVLVVIVAPTETAAIPVQQLDPNREWRIKSLRFSGNQRFSAGQIEEFVSTKTRPFYAFWRPFPRFDPAVFASDLNRIASFYRDRGYYQVKVSHDLEVDVDAGLVSAVVAVEEGRPVRVAELSLDIADRPELRDEILALLPKLPLRKGEIFVVGDYQETESVLREFLLDRGHAFAQVRREAQVILDRAEAEVSYTLISGPEAVFGATTIRGLEGVDEAIVRRELAYGAGEPFSAAALRETERNLRALDLFSLIQIEPDETAPSDSRVPVRLTVQELPPREIRAGIGYSTEEQLRGQVRWSHHNWLGGARRLEAGAKLSFIRREVDVAFVQPHFPDRSSRLALNFGPKQFDEPGYFLNTLRLQTRLERKFSDHLTGFIGHRLEYDRWTDVPLETQRRLEDFPNEGLLSGLSIGLFWNPVDNLLNPSRGWGISLMGEQVGGFLGGRFDFYKLTGEVRGYYPFVYRTVLASRLRIGFAEPIAGSKEVPIFERFYAGGDASVRGYGRSRLGPLSAADDPIGGRSLLEGSLELRRQFIDTLGGVLFVDYGQVSLHSFDVPVDDLRFSAGFGIRYFTPVGPLRFDVGFPFRPPRHDRSWQIHFSIGQAF